MIDDDLGPALVNVDLRPLRLAYLIHAGSVGEFVAAVAEAAGWPDCALAPNNVHLFVMNRAEAPHRSWA